MKFVIILFSFVAFSAGEQQTYKVPEERLARVQKVSNECATEFNVDPTLFSKVADAMIPRNEATNKYLHCFAIKNGLVDETGHINVDKVAGLLGDHPLADGFKEALTKCNEITKENPIETVVAMNDCYIKTAPVRFVF